MLGACDRRYTRMTSDSPDMVQLNTRVPKDLLDEIEKEWVENGYANRSEYVRHALRMAVQMSGKTPVTLGARSDSNETVHDEKSTSPDYQLMEESS